MRQEELHPCPDCETLSDVTRNLHGNGEEFYCGACNLAYNYLQPCPACGTRKFVYEDDTTDADFVCFQCETRYCEWAVSKRAMYK